VLGNLGPHAPRAASTDRLERFRDDYDNLQAALAWAWTADEAELALEIGAACCRYWLGAGSFHDARAWLQNALPKIDAAPPITRLHGLKAAGVIAFFVLADSHQADDLWAQAAAIAGELDLPEEVAWLDHRRAAVAWELGDIETSIAIQERLLDFHRQSGNKLATADLLHTLGESLRDSGNFDEAERQLEAADAIYREVGDEIGLANNSHSLADLALDRGQFAHAITLYHTTLTDYPGETGRHEAYCLAGIASALAATGNDNTAATIWGAVCNAERALGFRMLSSERKRYEQHLTRLEASESWTRGQRLTLQQAADKIKTSIAVTAPRTPTSGS
jgi:tetratricopeptide (TPR) repeat protein